MIGPIDMPQLPTEQGHYVVWTGYGGPQILYWGKHSIDFRTGCRKVLVTHWMGPLPTPEVADGWPA